MTNQPIPPRATASRARGRPSTFDREAALQTALELFWRHGYEGVSLADLTTAIGVASPSLYHAFGGKADLYRAVLRRYGADGMSPADVAAAASARDAAREMLERGIAAVTQPNRPLGCMVSSGMLMTGTENADLAAELRGMRATLREALHQRIERDMVDGVLPAETDAAALARFVASVLQGLSVQALDGASTAELTAVALVTLRSWPTCRAA